MNTVCPEDCTFETVVVDVTHRCNMACANCFLPNRDIADMDINRLEDCLARLPRRTNIRIAGAEPTMRRDLPEIITSIRKLGHRAVLLTNGLRLARRAYVDELYAVGLRHVYLSMNGADNDDWYERIDNLRCAPKKLSALRNVLAKRMILNTGTILVRGVNEDAMARMIEIVRGYAPRHALLRFKNVGALGRYDHGAEQENLSMQELEELASAATGHSRQQLHEFDRIKGQAEENTRLFPLKLMARPGSGIWIKLTNWQVNGEGFADPHSQRRGRITQDFKIAAAAEHVKMNEGGY